MKCLASHVLLIALIVMMTANTVKAEKFFEYVCSNSQCSSGCTNYEYTTGTCYPTTTGDSMIVHCRDGGMAIEQTIYEGSTNCNSFSHSNTVAAGVCGEIAGVPNEWMLYICGAGGVEANKKQQHSAAYLQKNVSIFSGPARLSVTEEMAQRASVAKVGVKTTLSTMIIPKEMLLRSLSPQQQQQQQQGTTFAVLFSNSDQSQTLSQEECSVTETGSLVVKHQVFRKVAGASATMKKKGQQKKGSRTATILVDQQIVARFHLKN